MLDDKLKNLLKNTAKKLSKHEKRAFMAEVTIKYFDGSAYKAERTLAWGREAIKLGMHELRTGIICLGNYSARGRKKTEEIYPHLKKDIQDIVENETQTDPKFQTNKRFCKVSAQSTCNALEKEKGYALGSLNVRTISNILNRLGYTLKKL